jgi:hypothetical protein
MLKRLARNYPAAILVLIAVVLCFLNYTSGTFLSGWDTLHPEFNLNLNLQRLINGVFRVEQGLGAVAAHSHMADLPHLLTLYVFNLFLPLSFLRYSYIFLNLILGPLGMYFLLNKFIVKNRLVSFLGSLFYLLNFGTMQQFIVPFEMFVVQYAALPWLFYFAIDYLFNKRSGKTLFVFALANFIASPMAYAATLWYFYFFCFLIYLLFLNIPDLIKKKFSLVKRSIKLVLITLLVNAYWILPNIYYVLAKGAQVSQANINKLFSDQAFLYNKEFGNLADISLLKTFLFDWGVYAGNNSFENLLSSWINHLNSPYVLQIGFLFAVLGLIGLMFSIISKNKTTMPFLPILIISLFFLINANWPTGFIYVFLQNHLPLFKEALRFPDDKVLGIYTFLYAIYFAFAMQFSYVLIKKIKPKIFSKVLLGIQVVIISALFIYYMLPAFKGQLISPFMRVSIPKEYFQVFNWFNGQQSEGRIAYLPVNSLWGWEYYKWYENKPSFQGAGFIWFGIKQPMLVRDFDRWNLKNEQFYKELSYAAYSKDVGLIKNVINKYQVQYLLLDKNIIAPEGDQSALFYNELDSILAALEKNSVLTKEANFNRLSVYKINKNYSYEPTLSSISNVSPVAQSLYNDFAYTRNDTYFSSNSLPSVNYQFRNIIDNQGKILPSRISIENDGVKISLNSDNSSGSSFLDLEEKIPASVLAKKNGTRLELSIYPQLPYQQSGASAPITSLIDISKNPGLILSINQNYNFVINNFDDNMPIALGNVFLNTKEDNSISAYSLKPDQVTYPDFSKLKLSVAPCLADKTSLFFGIDLEDEKNSFSVFAKKSPICMVIPLESLISQDIGSEKFLLSLDYDYKGKSNSSLCMVNINNGSCLNYVLKNASGGIAKARLNYFGIEKNNLKNLGIKIQADEYSGFLTEKNTYNNFIIGETKPFYSADFSKDLLGKSLGELTNINSRSITIPFSGDNQLSSDITNLPITDVNCKKDPFSINNNQEKKILKEQTKKYIRYFSQNGSACDHFSYSNLPQNQGYLIVISSRNISGLPMTICVLNQKSRHCDIYANLGKSSVFKNDIFLLPPMDNSDKNDFGYDINISNLGIKGTPTVNDLESIQIIPIPYRFLSSIKTVSDNTDKQIYTFPYAFEEGFSAYLVKDNLLARVFPFVMGNSLKEHVLVNNWANGWVLDKQSVENQKIIVVYWPQYLEYFGLLILLVTFIALTTKAVKKRS